MNNKKTNIILIFSLFFLSLSSCSESEDVKETGDSLIISAGIEPILATRTYLESGNIEEGLFHLTFPQVSESNTTDITYKIAEVNFIRTTGIPLDAEGKELSWQNIGYDGPGSVVSTLFLDNLSEDGEGTLVELSSTNAYRAGKLDKDAGSNDLLWGSLTSDRTQRQLNFQLHHCMSRVCVKILIERSDIQDPIELTDAAVQISDLALTPVRFDRTTGRLDLGESPVYSTLKFVESVEDWEIKNYNDPLNPDYICYQTKDFILPPQELKKDLTRPQLTISIPTPNGEPRIYEAVLPNAMTLISKEGVAYPTTLSFMRELYLTLTVLIKNDDLEVKFMPVTVVEWVDLDRISFSGTQAGIYSAQDFYDLISSYKDSREDILFHYGYKTAENKWVFNIFIDGISLELSRIEGKMVGDDYSFNFHNHNVSIFGDNESFEILNGRQGEERLCEILNHTSNNE